MAFIFPQKVLFKHCDPAGIVFYPRYFEMINDCIEAFFDAVLKLPFAELHGTGAVPTAEISTRFVHPSRLGDALEIRLDVVHVGRTSLGLELRADCTADCATEPRFHTKSTLVLVDGTGKPRAWPDPVRQTLEAYRKESDHGA